ncbi:MAG: Gfo/Idh/MocA family oxidoreductase [Planctomyces sp.]|nr:Gfo/Idh/MocA family oxidoreductase [Planctomyces sp.]
MIRFGILGCGRITARGLIPGIKGSSKAELYALASLRPGVAAEWAAEHGATTSYDSYDAVLADPKVDAVYIPATGEQHHALTLAAARAGKHVLCEKPLALNVEQSEDMIRVCGEQGVILQEAFMWRHHPRTKLARKLVEDGELGPLRLIVANFSFDIDRSDWRLNPGQGGGAMWDVGCYGVNAARLFAGSEPLDICAAAHWWPTGVDMTMQIALRFPNDVLANIDCSFEAPYRCQLELVGEKGRIVLDEAFQPTRPPVLKIQRLSSENLETQTLPESNQYAEQVNDFCDSIAAGRLLPPAENGLANMRVLEQALADARARAAQR